MQIPVLVEPVAGPKYRASTGGPLDLVAEAPTRDEALAKLQAQIQDRLRSGGEIATLDLAPPKHPWMEFAGMFKDDPIFEEVLEIMAENRRKMDRKTKARTGRKPKARRA
jgi:hypothetical protein